MLVFAASLRTESLNRKLAALAARTAEQYGATVDLASMRDFDVPLYDGDVERRSGIPQGAHEIRSRLLASDAFIISFHFSRMGGLVGHWCSATGS